jgi:hypothetical protein
VIAEVELSLHEQAESNFKNLLDKQKGLPYSDQELVVQRLPAATTQPPLALPPNDEAEASWKAGLRFGSPRR